ncbi:unnamed protein product, partial [Medioppia subpectinata]
KEYLLLYAERIGIRDNVKLRHELIGCQQNTDYDSTGRWRLTVRDIDNDRVFNDVVCGVMLCTGNYNNPSMPTFQNQHLFKGRVLHSHAFKNSTGFEGQRVVVVGVGNSGADIGVELSNVCKNINFKSIPTVILQIVYTVYMCAREGSWVIGRVGPGGRPFDSFLLRRSLYTLYNVMPYRMSCWALEKYLNLRFNHQLYALKPKHRVLSQHIVVNDELGKKIIAGQCIVKPNIQEFTENGVIFIGDTHETLCDTVVMATGYKLWYPFLPSALQSLCDSKAHFQLYKHMYYPHSKHPQTLAFIGAIVPLGALLPVAELQCRYASLVLAERLSLPSAAKMVTDISRQTVRVGRRFPDAEKFALHVHYVEYMEEMARLVGAKPRLWKYVCTDPKLWWSLYFGPCVPYQYRLNGPNLWPNARETILTVNKRIETPFRTRYGPK